MKIKFFEAIMPGLLDIKISDWAIRCKHEIVSVSLTTRKSGLENYIVACVVYK